MIPRRVCEVKVGGTLRWAVVEDAALLRDGADVLIVSSGLMTERALEAAATLEQDGTGVAVLHSPTIKPFDEEALLAQLGKGRLVLTADNHSVVGGLFDTVARVVARHGLGEQVTPIALPDAFLEAGALPTLNDRYGVSTGGIVDRVRCLL